MTTHGAHSVAGRRLVSVEPQKSTAASAAISVLSVCQVGAPALRDHLQVWSSRKSAHFMLSCLDSVAAQQAGQAVSKLVSCRAFHSTSNVLRVAASETETLGQLEVLQDRRVVELVSRDACDSAWRFSLYGSSCLRVANEVHNPEPVFKPLALVDPWPNLEIASNWQLYEGLKQLGFHPRARPSAKKKALALPPHTASSVNLVFYVSSASLSRARKYMTALLQSKKLFEETVVTRIHHCQPPSYYDRILDGSHAGSPFVALENAEPQQALQLDVEAFALPVAAQEAVVANEEPPKKRARRVVPEPVQNADTDAVSSPNLGGSDSGEQDSDISSLMRLFSDAETSECADEEEGPVSDSLRKAEHAEVSDHAPRVAEPSEAPSQPTAGKTHAQRTQHEDSFQWGPFRFTFSSPEKRPRFGQYQATCPYHRLNPRTGCKKALALRDSTEAEKKNVRTS